MKTAVCEAPGIAFVCNVWKWFGQDMEMQTPPSLWSCSSRHASAIASTRSRVHYRHFAALDAQDDYCMSRNLLHASSWVLLPCSSHLNVKFKKMNSQIILARTPETSTSPVLGSCLVLFARSWRRIRNGSAGP